MYISKRAQDHDLTTIIPRKALAKWEVLTYAPNEISARTPHELYSFDLVAFPFSYAVRITMPQSLADQTQLQTTSIKTYPMEKRKEEYDPSSYQATNKADYFENFEFSQLQEKQPIFLSLLKTIPDHEQDQVEAINPYAPTEEVPRKQYEAPTAEVSIPTISRPQA